MSPGWWSFSLSCFFTCSWISPFPSPSSDKAAPRALQTPHFTSRLANVETTWRCENSVVNAGGLFHSSNFSTGALSQLLENTQVPWHLCPAPGSWGEAGSHSIVKAMLASFTSFLLLYPSVLLTRNVCERKLGWQISRLSAAIENLWLKIWLKSVPRSCDCRSSSLFLNCLFACKSLGQRHSKHPRNSTL